MEEMASKRNVKREGWNKARNSISYEKDQGEVGRSSQCQLRLKMLKDYLPKHIQARKDNYGLPEEPMPEVMHGKLCTVAETLPSSKTFAVAGAVCSRGRSSAKDAVRSRLANLRVGLFDRGEFSQFRFSLCFPFSIVRYALFNPNALTFGSGGSRRFGGFNSGRTTLLHLFLFILSLLPGKRDARSQRLLTTTIGSFNVWKV